MSALGYCRLDNCHGSLCTRGQEVCCSQCGLPHPDHPLAKQIAATPPDVPKPISIAGLEYNGTWNARLVALEKRVEADEKRAVEDAARIARLEKIISSGSGKRTG